MGGFGAYAIARLEPGRFCAVGGHSATIRSTVDAAQGAAFDDAADFARNDVLAAARQTRTCTAARSFGWTMAPTILSMTATSSSPAPCTSPCTPGPAATTSHTPTRTGATTWTSTPARSRPAGSGKSAEDLHPNPAASTPFRDQTGSSPQLLSHLLSAHSESLSERDPENVRSRVSTGPVVRAFARI
jgi:hypothetical protein